MRRLFDTKEYRYTEEGLAIDAKIARAISEAVKEYQEEIDPRDLQLVIEGAAQMVGLEVNMDFQMRGKK